MVDPDLDTAKEVYFPPQQDSPPPADLVSPLSPSSKWDSEDSEKKLPLPAAHFAIDDIDDGLQRRPSYDGTAPEALPPDYPEVLPPSDPELRSEEFPEACEKAPGAGDSSSKAAGGAARLFKGRRKWWLLGGIALILVIIGVVVGAVVGTRDSNSSNSSGGGGSSKADKASSSSSSSVSSSASQTSATHTSSGPAIATPKADAFDVGRTYNASFTFYGTGDEGAGINCTTIHNGCGFYASPGYTVAVSQNLFGTDFNHTPGPACGTCWRLKAERDASGDVMNSTIVAMVNNLCPAENNPLCAMKNLENDYNAWDAVVDFNLCIDSGASDALLGKGTGVGLAVGSAKRVDCKEWEGKRSDK